MSGSCLGTRLQDADDDRRPIAVLLSDLHLTQDGGAGLDAFALVLERVRRDAARTRVVVLGDLFDAYATDAQLRLPRWDEVVGQLRATVDAGASIAVLHGNRDFLLGRRFAGASGCRVVTGGLWLRLGGRRVLCLHGDELCLRDTAYQRAKRVLRSWPVRALARTVPGWVALRAGRGARARSTAVVRAADPARTDATAGAVDRAFAETGADVLVFGHVHRAAHHPAWPGGGEVWILPAFDDAGVHLRHEGGAFRVVDAAGEPAGPLPPRQLT